MISVLRRLSIKYQNASLNYSPDVIGAFLKPNKCFSWYFKSFKGAAFIGLLYFDAKRRNNKVVFRKKAQKIHESVTAAQVGSSMNFLNLMRVRHFYLREFRMCESMKKRSN